MKWDMARILSELDRDRLPPAVDEAIQQRAQETANTFVKGMADGSFSDRQVANMLFLLRALSLRRDVDLDSRDVADAICRYLASDNERVRDAAALSAASHAVHALVYPALQLPREEVLDILRRVQECGAPETCYMPMVAHAEKILASPR